MDVLIGNRDRIPGAPHPAVAPPSGEGPAHAPQRRVTLPDLRLDGVGRSERVERLREAYFRACPEVCIERPRLITRLHRELGLFDQDRISVLDKARVYRRVLEAREPIVWHTRARDRTGAAFGFAGDSLFAGSTTSRFKGVILYPEMLALALWPELRSLGRRSANPYQLDADEADVLNREVFPAWLDRTILEHARTDAASSPAETRPRLDLLQHMVFFLASKPNCISHTIPDFSRAVREGLRAIIDDARGHEGAAAEPDRRMFYAAMAEALEGVITCSRNLGRRAAELAGRESDPRRRAELETLARIHAHVPEYPARSFREGLTAVWMCWIACHLENANVGLSLGRLDQLLYDLYRRDVEAGVLGVPEAVELCECLWLKIGDHVPTVPEAGEQLFGGSGSNQAITLGGVDAGGNDAVNDLTYVMLRATELMQLRDPNLNARYMPGVNSIAYLRRLCLANLRTGATPALHNDAAVIEALTGCGDTLAQARDYGVVGCVEPCSNGRHFGHSGALLFNLASALELTLFNGRHRHTGLDRLISFETGDPAGFTSFEQFRAAFARQVEWLVTEAVRVNDALGRAHQAIHPEPILSALFEGPMQKGVDVIEGGAVINSSGAAIIGLGDTADSLSAIRRLVFEERSITMAELLAAIARDFAGDEALAARLRDPARTPKWGNEDPVGDGNTEWIIRTLHDLFRARVNYRGGRYRVGYWTMTNHAGFGRLMGALPSGRRARESFTSGFTPVSGMTPQLTPALNSIAAMPARCLTSGVALNVKLVPEDTVGGDEAAARLAAMVDAFFRGPAGGTGVGGMEIQFNVTRREDFIEATRHPERYPELLVRVSGYTAYFKDLNPQMQKEIIDRTEYVLSTGMATQPPPFHLAPIGDAKDDAKEGAKAGGAKAGDAKAGGAKEGEPC